MSFTRIDVALGPAEFHDVAPGMGGRRLWVPRLDDRRTLVLGSTQAETTIDTEALHRAEIEITRRRSGGGAVLVSEYDVLWFDLLIDRSDHLWVDDVGRAFEWVGEACAIGLTALGMAVEMHRGRPITTDWSDALCFAGLGPGELTHGGRKVLGISQRRTRAMARFQVAVLLDWDPELQASLLADRPDRRATAADLAELAAAVQLPAEALLAAITAELP